jgi:hypothetical protein
MFETGQVFQMIRRASASVGIAASLGLAAAVPPSYASDTLVGRAVLPAATFAEGPNSWGLNRLTARVCRSLTNNRCRASRRFATTAMARSG